MKVLKIGEQNIELCYTYNSFKYMEELDLTVLDKLDKTPFKILGVVEELLMGAVNNSPHRKIQLEEVQEFLEVFIAEGDLVELLTDLVTLLEESSFFKSLQKKESKKATPKSTKK